MKEAIIHPDLSIVIRDAEIPKPMPDEMIIKVVLAGTNPIDWKGADEKVSRALHGDLENPLHSNPGKCMAVYVYSVGSNIHDFKVGDRVVATNHSSGFAEYGVGPAYTTAHIPDNVSFEEACTTGLVYTTTALGLYKSMSLPPPWAPAKTPTPLLVYAASTAVGTFAVKLAILSNIHPIIAITGASSKEVALLLYPTKGDILLDYRSPKADLVNAIHAAAPSINHIIDNISDHDTLALVVPLLRSKHSEFAFSPRTPGVSTPTDVKSGIVFAPGLWEPKDPEGIEVPERKNFALRAFGRTFMGFLTLALKEGLLTGHPYEVLPGGLAGLEEGPKWLKEGRNGGVKYLCKIEETPGVVQK